MTRSRRGDLVYPERQRCLACRNYFGPLVIQGYYDSYACAGMPAPSDDPADWPRGHYFIKDGRPQKKASFPCEGEARQAIPDRVKGMNAYPCDYCGMWHIGTLRLRGVGDDQRAGRQKSPSQPRRRRR